MRARLANLLYSTAAITPLCRAAGPVGVLKRVAPAEAAVAPGIGHALLEGIEAAVRSTPATPPYSVHHGAAEAAPVPKTTVPSKMDATVSVRMMSVSKQQIPLLSRQADAGLVTVAAGVGLLPFAPVDWIDIVDAAPAPLATDFQATQRRQMIEQVRHRVFCPIIAD